MKSLLMFLCGIIVTSCNLTTSPSSTGAHENASQITYTKDDRSGLCFGMLNSMHSGYESTSITCVPCDSVEKLISK